MPPENSSTSRDPARRNRDRAGSVILLVLMTLLLTAFALTKYLEKTAIDLLADAREVRAERLRVEAYSALETVLAVLQEFRAVDGALHSPAEGWGAPLEFAGYAPPEGLTVEAALEDESGKIPLPQADFQTLRDLFLLLGQKQSDAERLADALLVWMQADYEPVDSFSARATDYERDTLPHDPPLRSLHSFAELASIRYVRDLLFDEQGRPNELWQRFVDSVSLYDFERPNLNGASATTLGALGGYDAAGVRVLTDYLGGAGAYTQQGPDYFRTTQEVTALVGQTATSARLDTQVHCLRINVTVREGRTAFRLTAVVAPPGEAALPPAAPPAAAGSNTTGQDATDSTSSAAASTATPPAAPAADTASGTQTALNYPFTLLEIRENDEITGSFPSAQPAPE
ncbi:MAG: type II secretion system protein GspK [Opitutaceae bacterium]|nr:type II secretion system protein GspK [Opitutaceae bacterium]